LATDGTIIGALGSGFSLPYGVAVQPNGQIVIADTGNNAIKRMNADGTNIVTLATGFNKPFRLHCKQMVKF
jgi:NHL repeat.